MSQQISSHGQEANSANMFNPGFEVTDDLLIGRNTERSLVLHSRGIRQTEDTCWTDWEKQAVRQNGSMAKRYTDHKAILYYLSKMYLKNIKLTNLLKYIKYITVYYLM